MRDLSYNITKYLSLLVGNGLIEYQEGKRTFKITQNGLHFLQIHNNIRQLITPLISSSKNHQF